MACGWKGRWTVKKVPRNPAASWSVVAVDPGSNRPRPPANLRGPERNLFIELIAANPPQHFRLSDRPLLTQYVAAASHDITVLKMHWRSLTGSPPQQACRHRARIVALGSRGRQ